MVFYRKYRPQTIEELDSASLRETLFSVFAQKNIPHAFLFTGPKGLGKTSTARIVAKVINCTHDDTGKALSVKGKELHPLPLTLHPNIEPDNTCSQCVAITNGSSLDVLEIDGASNRGIDEVRDLRDRVKLAPSSSKKKVYIIDEVHMLTTEAFNALLKTIEEPPSHVIFIFCTTELAKVPATIVSRCFHINFSLATTAEIVHSLSRIVQAEKISITSDALTAIASLSDGAFRDATKILEEMMIVAQGKEITREFVETIYKVSGISYLVSSLLEVLVEKNVAKVLEIVEKIVAQGMDIKYFIAQLLETLHQLVLDKTGIMPNTKYQILNTKYTLEDIQLLVMIFSDAYTQTKTAVIPQLPLEMAVIAYCSVIPTEQKRVEGSHQDKTEISPFDSAQGRNDNVHTMDSMIKKQYMQKVNAILRPVEKKQDGLASSPQVKGEQADISSSISLMDNLIYKVKPLNHSLAGVLRGTRIVEITPTEVILEALYKFHKERLEERKSYEIIEKAVREITGKKITVTITLKK